MAIKLNNNSLHAMLLIAMPLFLIALSEMVCGESGVLMLHQKSMLLLSLALDFITALTTVFLFVVMLLYSATMVAQRYSHPIKTQRTFVTEHQKVMTGVIIKKMSFTRII